MTGDGAAPPLSRRACLAGLAAMGAVLPSLGEAAPTPRVVCLEWAAAEMVLALGVDPVAVGDVAAYRDWVVEPALPTGVLDLGARGQPNLELLAALKADLIVGASGYGYEELALERFAPLHVVRMFVGEGSAFSQAASELGRLAAALGRPEAAERAIADADRRFSDASRVLAGRIAEPLLVASMFEERYVRVYGGRGLFQDALDRLGLRNAWQGRANPWGFAYVSLDQLIGLDKTLRLVSLDPVPEHLRIRLSRSGIWPQLPFVAAGRITTIDPVWPFGGLAAAARFAGELADRLPRA